MIKSTSPAPHRRRPWRLLRLALLWARKDGPFKHRHFFHLRFLPSFLKNLRRADTAGRLHYRERELSFDDTPAFHFKFHRPASSLRLPRIPCITPSVNFDDDEAILSERCWEMKLLEARACEEVKNGGDEEAEEEEEEEEEGEQEIDSRAERFIVEFYEQMKLQRQISYLEYDEMLHRGLSG